jgi:ABC-type Mn2+/Zn2+ transport system ATPase subunit
MNALQNRQVALDVHNLSAGYEGISVLKNASFEVLQGERIGVLGPNGAGKSTLFKAIVGLIPHHTGHISFHGQDCDASHSMIGYVPQVQEIDWHFPVTVGDVVMMGRTRKIGWVKLPGRHHWHHVDEALEKVGMQHLKNRQIGALSGGQRRRVFIARALAQETDVLLLDEPFSGVDVAAEEEIMETLDILRGDGITVLVATHDMHAAQTQFDKLLLVNTHVVAFGTPQEVLHPEQLRETFGRQLGIFQDQGQLLVVADVLG